MSGELANEEKVTIVSGDPVSDFWLDGTVNRYPDYRFKAKVFDVGSPFGIAQERISKLEVWRHDTPVMHYSRGWDQMPATRRDRKVLKEILAGFPGRGREKAESGIGGEERGPASRQSFRSGRLRAPRLGRDRSDQALERPGDRREPVQLETVFLYGDG
jgi:hypothetical protein